MSNVTIEVILDDIRAELERAQKNYPKMNSFHEGYAIILEELDEVWDEIKMKNHNVQEIYRELIQVGAMCVRCAYDNC